MSILPGWIPPRPSRHLLLRMLVVVSVLALHLTMWGHAIDSLYLEYPSADKARKTVIINTISNSLYKNEVTDTLYHCDSSTSPKMMDAIIHYMMGEHMFEHGLYDKALEEGLTAKELVAKEKASQLQSDVLGLVSKAQYRLGILDESLKTLLEAYQVDKKLGNLKLISSDLNSLATIYLAVQDPEPGISFIEKAIALERKMKRTDRLATRLGTAAKLYLMNNDLDKATAAIDEAYDLDKRNNRTEKAADKLLVKAAIQERRHELPEAQKTLLNALPVLEHTTNTYSLATCYNQLGSVYSQLGDNDKAIAYYKKGLKLSIKYGMPACERDAEHGLWILMRDDNPGVAMLHLERYTTLTDSMYRKMTLVRPQVIDITANHFHEAEWNKNSAIIANLIKWGSVALGLMLLVMIAGLFYAWRKGKIALRMQRQTLAMRDHFLANITQRLHTPLTVITNTGHQMVEQGRPSTEETKRMGETIVKHSNDMLQLLDQMTNLENVRSSVELPELKPGDIVMFVRMLVENFIGTAHSKLINLEFTSPMTSMTVVFAPNYVKRICHVLISNSILYTPRNGSVTVGLHALEGGKMRLTVADTGPGIPQNERDRIFEPMYQSHQNGDDGLGTVMELSMVNYLVKTLNGTITMDSELGRGTVFTIEFPVQPVESDGSAEAESMQTFIEKRFKLSKTNNKLQPLVFIVENNEDVAYFIAKHLKEKYNLRFARDGKEALQNAQDLVPDLIITNMTMPVMDGWELIKRLKANPELNHIPIIAMTANNSDQQRIACYNTGADNVLVKPFNSSELRLLADLLIMSRNTLREHFVKHESNLNDQSQATSMSKEDQEFINKLIDVIHAQMAKDDIDMEHIAAALSLSRKQLRSRVMAITGQNPVAYVLKVRLNFARRMVANENLSLTTIATKCGFQNLSHFSKAFKQQYGMSPLQFRKNIDDISQTPPKI